MYSVVDVPRIGMNHDWHAHCGQYTQDWYVPGLACTVWWMYLGLVCIRTGMYSRVDVPRIGMHQDWNIHCVGCTQDWYVPELVWTLWWMYPGLVCTIGEACIVWWMYTGLIYTRTGMYSMVDVPKIGIYKDWHVICHGCIQD